MEGAFVGNFGTAMAVDVPGRRVFFVTIVGRFFFGVDVTLPAAIAEPEVVFFLHDLPMMNGIEARNSGTIYIDAAPQLPRCTLLADVSVVISDTSSCQPDSCAKY